MVSGSRSARGSPEAFLRRVRMPSDSCSMTSSEPSGRILTVLSGTDFAPFLTRQARCASAAENRMKRSMEKNPRVGEVEDARPEGGFQLIGQGVLAVVVAAGRGGDP